VKKEEDRWKKALTLLQEKGYFSALPHIYQILYEEKDLERKNLLRYHLAIYALSSGEPETAIELLRAILKDSPHHPLAYPLYSSLLTPIPLSPPPPTTYWIRVLLPSNLLKEPIFFKEPAWEGETILLPSYEGTLLDLFSLPFTTLSGEKGSPLRFRFHSWEGEGYLHRIPEGIVLEIPLQNYLVGVLSAEMGEEFPLEALKAQAVLSRTYILYLYHNNPEAPYHVRGEVFHQAFVPPKNAPEIEKAVKETEGEILTYQGEIAVVFFHADNGGTTEDPSSVWGTSFPYYRIMYDPFSNYLPPWELTLPLKEIETLLKIPPIRKIRLIRSRSGRIQEWIFLSTNGNSTKISGNQFRLMVGPRRLRSLKCEVKIAGRILKIVGVGYGHGVGMSQWGAYRMAKKGLTYREILSFYYPGTELKIYSPRLTSKSVSFFPKGSFHP